VCECGGGCSVVLFLWQPAHTAQFCIKRQLRSWEYVAVCGNVPELGAWDPALALPLRVGADECWRGGVPLPALARVEYKYVVLKTGSGDNVPVWEEGSNRCLVVNGDLVAEDTWEEVSALRTDACWWRWVKGCGSCGEVAACCRLSLPCALTVSALVVVVVAVVAVVVVVVVAVVVVVVVVCGVCSFGSCSERAWWETWSPFESTLVKA
jgi:hypothetical protein